jgi:hypothetical protein
MALESAAVFYFKQATSGISISDKAAQPTLTKVPSIEIAISEQALQDAFLDLSLAFEEPSQKEPQVNIQPVNEERLRKFLKRMDSAY